MRSGISFTVSAGERQRLRAIVADPKSPQAWRTSMDKPVALIWRRRRYFVQDPELGRFNPMNKALAADIHSTGFQLYPGLPEEASVKSLVRFSLHNSFGQLRAVIIAAVLAMLLGLIVPIATAAVVATAIPD